MERPGVASVSHSGKSGARLLKMLCQLARKRRIQCKSPYPSQMCAVRTSIQLEVMTCTLRACYGLALSGLVSPGYTLKQRDFDPVSTLSTPALDRRPHLARALSHTSTTTFDMMYVSWQRRPDLHHARCRALQRRGANYERRTACQCVRSA